MNGKSNEQSVAFREIHVNCRNIWKVVKRGSLCYRMRLVSFLGEEKIVISVTLLELVMPSVKVDVEYHNGPIRQTS